MNKPDSNPNIRDIGLRSLSRALNTSFIWLYGLIAILLIVIASQSLFVVGSQEIGIVYRFGKIRDVLSTGTHWCWPYPIEERIKLPCKKEMTIKSNAFQIQLNVNPDQYMNEGLRPDKDGYIISSDGAIIHLQNCSLTYSVDTQNKEMMLNFLIGQADQIDHLGRIEITGREQALLHMLERAVVATAAETDSSDILRQPELFQSKTLSKLRANALEMKWGVVCEKVVIRGVVPMAVAKAYENASNARNEEQKILSGALQKQTQIESDGMIQAHQIQSQAKAYQSRQISSAKASALNFQKLLIEYQRDPILVKQRLRNETIARILTNAEEKFIIQSDQSGELRLLLGRNPDRVEKEQDSEQ